MKRCENCNSLMPDDAAHCIRCGHDSSKAGSMQSSADVDQSTRRSPVNWVRVCAAVFTSKLFFLGSCSLTTLGFGLLDDPHDFGPAITENHSVPKLTSVIATVPDTKQSGQRKAVVVFVSALKDFKSKNPDHSFLLPPGEGKIDDPDAEMWTKYAVRTSGLGKIMVESTFHHDVPPAGVDVRQRYEATANDVRILNAKYGGGFLGPLVAGLVIASILLITGRILKWRISRAVPPLSAERMEAAKAKITKKTRKIVAIAIALGVLVSVVIIIMSNVLG